MNKKKREKTREKRKEKGIETSSKIKWRGIWIIKLF